ncbi:PAAR domain-containing protein [Erwinia pyrifoliae]|uniref:PAAR domain-containing protein n=1 Tax=Erwinia pyrifoliae TaxID=79967 RepID=A0ABY5X6H9_ERWPY|nr:PAAR domain-containing protein [Erwinia pyrifoliae]UWS32889.1 PAAR domain-containing protein [Erwinia pyrifoliae]
MGKPAARALIDQGAHSGPIQSGSPDVMIGGFPAARKGDSVSCSQHGSGIIVGGSASVIVNGQPLARLGDKTQCQTGGKPPVPPKKAAPPQYWGATLAKNAAKDGLLHGDLYDARTLGAFASTEDKTGEGDSDTASLGFALTDLTLGNMKSDSLLRGESRTKVASGSASGTYYGYDHDSDITGFNANASASGVQYGGTAAAGKQGVLYGSVTGDVTVVTAETKLIGEVYKGNQGRYGFTAEAGAETAVVKGEGAVNFDIYGVFVSEAKLGGTAGGAGAAAGFTGYFDTTDYSINARLSGELALIVGLKGDVSLKITFKKIVDYIYKDVEGESKVVTKVDSGDGCINTGCITVLIGG